MDFGLLTDADIAFMQSARDQIVYNRTVDVILERETAGVEDDYSGNPTVVTTYHPAQATWQAFTGSGTSGNDIRFVDGIEMVRGEVIANLDIDVDVSGLNAIQYRGVRYIVRAIEQMGIGEDNRHFVLLRRAS